MEKRKLEGEKEGGEGKRRRREAIEKMDRAMRAEVKEMLRELELEGKVAEGEELEREEGSLVEKEREIDRQIRALEEEREKVRGKVEGVRGRLKRWVEEARELMIS